MADAYRTEQYQQWNPFMLSLSGALCVGHRLTVTMGAGRRTMTFHPIVQAFEHGTLLRWRGRRGVSGLLDGEHELRVEATAPGTCRFTQQEAFRGILVPVMRRLLDDTDTGFAAMNAARPRHRSSCRTGVVVTTDVRSNPAPMHRALHIDEGHLNRPCVENDVHLLVT